jgi:hypothetical protein
MPAAVQHLTQAQHNESFADSLGIDETPYLDWYVTVLFYGALHRVQALLHLRGLSDEETDLHSKRDNILAQEDDVWGLRENYRQLKDDSEDARYGAASLTLDQVKQIRTEFYDRVKERVSALIEEEVANADT